MFCFFNDFTHIFYPRAYCADDMKGSLDFIGDDISYRGLAHPWWSPQYHGGDIAGGNRFSNNAVSAHQMFLTNEIFQSGRSHAFC